MRQALTIESLVSKMKIIIPTVFVLYTNSYCHVNHQLSCKSHLITCCCLFTKCINKKVTTIHRKISTFQFEKKNQTRICLYSTKYTASIIMFIVFIWIANCNTWLKIIFSHILRNSQHFSEELFWQNSWINQVTQVNYRKQNFDHDTIHVDTLTR